MEEFSDKLEIFKILKKIKKQENFNMSLMSRQERIDYIVQQMKWIENNLPEMVEFIEDDFDMGFEQ